MVWFYLINTIAYHELLSSNFIILIVIKNLERHIANQGNSLSLV